MNDDSRPDIQRMLGAAFTDEPPLRFERAQVIARGRRVQRNRRLIAAGSAVFSVAVLTAGILFVAGFQGASGIPVQPANPICTVTQIPPSDVTTVPAPFGGCAPMRTDSVEDIPSSGSSSFTGSFEGSPPS
jgi:hypothetical protein